MTLSRENNTNGQPKQLLFYNDVKKRDKFFTIIII